MTEIEKSYTRWCDRATEDPDITEELRSIAGNENEIRERFYRPLAFGTGGLRGVCTPSGGRPKGWRTI